MARQEELEIRIDADGTVRVEVRGMRGSRCLEYVEVFQQLLGPVEDQRPTPEFYEAEQVTHAQSHLRSNTGSF